MPSRRMNWDKIRMEERGRLNGIEWTKGKRRFKPWITSSTADADETQETESNELRSSLTKEEREALIEQWLTE